MSDIGFLFDLDGVLIDSESEYTRIWNEIDTCFPSGKENFASVIKGQTLTRILSENYPDREVQLKVKEMLHEKEKEMSYKYCPNAEDFLDSLNEKKLKIAVVTSSDEVKMNHLYADIPDFLCKINVVIDATRVTRSKPDPQGYLIGARELGVAIGNCVVFEDSVQGVKAGNAAGAYVVGITGTKTREDLQPYSHRVIDNFSEIDIEELIEKIS